MAPRDLLEPLDGQRQDTLKVLSSLSEADLDRVDEGTGWSIRAILGHVAAAERGEAFFIRRAARGEVIQMDLETRDGFNHESVEKTAGWDLERLRGELVEARETLTEVFGDLTEDDLDRPIRWPEWPARTIRASIPYMLEHEDAHLDQVRRALDLD